MRINIKNIAFLLLIIFSSALTFGQQKQDSTSLKRQARKWVRQGNTLYNQQKFTDASVAYKKALGKDKSSRKAINNLGSALYQQKNYKAATKRFKQALKMAKDKFVRANDYHDIGNAMMQQKQYNQAVEAYKNALRKNPKDDETRYNLAVAQQRVKQQKKKNKNKKGKNKKGGKGNDKNKGDGEDKKDQNNKKNKNDKGKPKDGKNKKPKNDKKNQKQPPQPQRGKMSPQQIRQLLQSLNNEEKKTQQKMNLKKQKGRKIKREKDW